MTKFVKNNLSVWHFSIPFVILMAFTRDRYIHFLWALVFMIVGIVILLLIRPLVEKRTDRNIFKELVTVPGVPYVHIVLMSVYVVYLGSWIPDIDWHFKVHRSPITHSVVPFLAAWFLTKKFSSFGNKLWNEKLLLLFGYGLSSHLVSDIIPGGNVVGMPVWLDMPFLFVNGVAIFCLTLYLQLKQGS